MPETHSPPKKTPTTGSLNNQESEEEEFADNEQLPTLLMMHDQEKRKRRNSLDLTVHLPDYDAEDNRRTSIKVGSCDFCFSWLVKCTLLG